MTNIFTAIFNDLCYCMKKYFKYFSNIKYKIVSLVLNN